MGLHDQTKSLHVAFLGAIQIKNCNFESWARKIIVKETDTQEFLSFDFVGHCLHWYHYFALNKKPGSNSKICLGNSRKIIKESLNLLEMKHMWMALMKNKIPCIGNCYKI